MIADDWLGSIGRALVDMLPHYTEPWATTYLQVLFQSFLFALGVPTALYSLVIDNDIKRVAQTRVKFRRYFYGAAMLYAAVLIIVWFLHPEAPLVSPQAPPAPENVAAAVLPEPPATPAAPPTGQVVPQAQADAQQGTVPAVAAASPPPVKTPARPEVLKGDETAATVRGPISMFKSIFAASTVTILPIIVLVYGYQLNKYFKRETVVANLADELLARLDAERNIDIVALKDLSYLGEHGQAGEEKEIVLNIIDRLAETVRKRKEDGSLEYNGYELESLIRHIPQMLDNPTQPGNDQNFTRAVEVLANIWRWFDPDKVTDDAIATRETLRRLALYSVEKMAEATSHNYLEIAAECDSHMVFEMALAAIKAGRYPLAIAALGKLESLASIAFSRTLDPEAVKKYGLEPLGAAAKEAKGNLLGVAALLAAGSPSGESRTEKIFRDNKEMFSPSIRHALTSAFDYHCKAGHLDIADKIRQLSTEAVKMKTIDIDAHIHCDVRPAVNPPPVESPANKS